MSNWLGDEIPQPIATLIRKKLLANGSLEVPELCTRQPQYLRLRRLRFPTAARLVKEIGAFHLAAGLYRSGAFFGLRHLSKYSHGVFPLALLLPLN